MLTHEEYLDQAEKVAKEREEERRRYFERLVGPSTEESQRNFERLFAPKGGGEPPSPGALDVAGTLLGDFTKGIASAGAGMSRGATELLDPLIRRLVVGPSDQIPQDILDSQPLSEHPVMRGANAVEDFVGRNVLDDPRMDPNGFARQVAHGLGQLAGMVPAGVAASTIGGGGILGAILTAIPGSTLEADALFRQTLQELQQQGVSGPQAEQIAAVMSRLGAAIGITEVIPLGELANRITKTKAGKDAVKAVLKAAGIQGAEEGLQEFFQTIGENLGIKGVINPEQDVAEGAVRAGAVGATVGAIAGGFGGAIQQERGAGGPSGGNPDVSPKDIQDLSGAFDEELSQEGVDQSTTQPEPRQSSSDLDAQINGVRERLRQPGLSGSERRQLLRLFNELTDRRAAAQQEEAAESERAAVQSLGDLAKPQNVNVKTFTDKAELERFIGDNPDKVDALAALAGKESISRGEFQRATGMPAIFVPNKAGRAEFGRLLQQIHEEAQGVSAVEDAARARDRAQERRDNRVVRPIPPLNQKQKSKARPSRVDVSADLRTAKVGGKTKVDFGEPPVADTSKTISEPTAGDESLTEAELDALFGDELAAAKTESEVKVGDLVQRFVAGEEQFPAPVRITGFTADGNDAFVDIAKDPIPIEQLRKAKPLPDRVKSKGLKRKPAKIGVRPERVKVGEGRLGDTVEEIVRRKSNKAKLFLRPDNQKKGVIVAPSVKRPGKFQSTFFDEDGFGFDEQFDTEEEAIKDARVHHLQADPDVFDKLSATQRFRRGVELSLAVQMRNILFSKGEIESADSVVEAFRDGGLDAAKARFDEIRGRAKAQAGEGPGRVDVSDEEFAAAKNLLTGIQNPKDVEPLLRALFPDFTEVEEPDRANDFAFGIHRMANRGDEIHRVPLVDLTKRIREAKRRGVFDDAMSESLRRSGKDRRSKTDQPAKKSKGKKGPTPPRPPSPEQAIEGLPEAIAKAEEAEEALKLYLKQSLQSERDIRTNIGKSGKRLKRPRLIKKATPRSVLAKDPTYVRLKKAVRSADARVTRLKNSKENAAARQQRKEDRANAADRAARGEFPKEVVQFVPVSALPFPLRRALQGEADAQLSRSANRAPEKTKEALRFIVEGREDARTEVVNQKRKLMEALLGERNTLTAGEKGFAGELGQADPIVQYYAADEAGRAEMIADTKSEFGSPLLDSLRGISESARETEDGARALEELPQPLKDVIDGFDRDADEGVGDTSFDIEEFERIAKEELESKKSKGEKKSGVETNLLGEPFQEKGGQTRIFDDSAPVFEKPDVPKADLSQPAPIEDAETENFLETPDERRAKLEAKKAARAKKSKGAKDRADDALGDLFDHLKKENRGPKLPSNPLGDPETIRLAFRAMVAQVDAGVTKFSEVIGNLADKLGDSLVRALEPVLIRGWDRIKQARRGLPLDDSSPVATILQERADAQKQGTQKVEGEEAAEEPKPKSKGKKRPAGSGPRAGGRSSGSRSGTSRRGNVLGNAPEGGQTKRQVNPVVTIRERATDVVPVDQIPEDIAQHLRPHQKQAVAKAVTAMAERGTNRGGFLLADGTGVGKTRTEIAVAAMALREGKTVLIVTKNEVIKPVDWKKGTVSGSFDSDARAMGVRSSMVLVPGGRITPGAINVTTYFRIRGDNITGVDGNTVLILDESHAIKNLSSQQSIAGMKMVEAAHSVMYASATPGDRAINIPYLYRSGLMDTFATRDEFYDHIGLQKIVPRDPKKSPYWTPKNDVTLAQINEKIAALFDRATRLGKMIKRELSMGDIEVEVKHVPIDSETRSNLQLLEEHFPLEGRFAALGVTMQRIHQEPGKVGIARKMIDEELAKGRKVIVYAARINRSEASAVVGFDPISDEPIKDVILSTPGALAELAGMLKKDGVPFAELHGQAKDRSGVAKFQGGEVDVILATIESGGTGINLDDSAGDKPRSVIVVTAPWSSLQLMQAIGRTWRLGTRSKPSYKILYSDTFIDSRQSSVIRQKLDTLGAVVSGAASEVDPTVEGRIQRARQDFDDAVSRFGNITNNRTFSNPLDPELLSAAANVARASVRLGRFKFEAHIRALAKNLGDSVVRKMGPALRKAWDKIAEKNPKMDKSSDVGAILDVSPPDEPEKPAPARPDLANVGETTRSRDFVDDVDRLRNEAELPESRSDSEVIAQAKGRLQKDYEGELKRLASSQAVLNDVDVVVAKMLINAEANKAFASNDVDRLALLVSLIDNYRGSGSEQARAFRQRRDKFESPEQRRVRLVQEAVLKPSQSFTSKINDARRTGDQEEIDRIRRLWAEEIDKIREQLKKLGIDLSDLDKLAENDVLIAKIITQINALKSDVWDAAYEYWRNAILSAPTTQIVNIAGNVVHAGWHFTAERMVEAMVNGVARRPDGARVGEFIHMAKGLMPGIARGFRNALKSWHTELPSLESDAGIGVVRFEDTNVAIKGKKGKLIRIPQRILLLADEFTKSVVAQMDVGAQAYRVAKSEGLSGDELSNRIAELVADTESIAWSRAIRLSTELAFQSPGGALVEAILKARNFRVAGTGLRPLAYFFPFVTTPANIFKLGVQKSPLGSAKLAYRLYRGAKTGNFNGITPLIAQQIIAWGLLMMLLGNDPDDPWITGAAAERSFRKRATARRARPSQSIRLGDTWYSYARVEPFATTIALMVDFVDAMQSSDSGKIANAPFASIAGQLQTKTFLQGMSDMMNLLDQDQPFNAAAKWASNFGSSWVPNIARSAGRSSDDVFMNRRVWEKDFGKFMKQTASRGLQKTELKVLPDTPIIDLWGEEAKRSFNPVADFPGSDFTWRFLVPLRTRKATKKKGDLVILKWNLNHPGAEYNPIVPRTTFTRKGKKFQMNEDQYTQYLRLSGKAAAIVVESSRLDPDRPTEDDRDALSFILSTARAKAKDNLYGVWTTGRTRAKTPMRIAREVMTRIHTSKAKGAEKARRRR